MILLVIVVFVVAVLLFTLDYSLDKKVCYRNLKEKHVVITGGSSGIGKAAAIEAGRLGAHVTIIGRDVGKLEAAVNEISAHKLNANQKIQYAALDVTSEYKTIEECLSSLEAEIGPIFMLVNCAGMCICGLYETMKIEDIKQITDLNYYGTAYPTKYVLSGMKARNEGLIVFVSSEAALIGIYGYTAYSGSKWAVRGLAEALNMELVGTNVRLTLAFPPDTDTPGLKNEDRTKPEETRRISSTAGLHSPKDVGKQMIHDAMIGKVYSTYSISGFMLSTLFGGLIEGPAQILLQVFSMGFLRIFFVALLLLFHKIVRNSLKNRKDVKVESKNE